MQLARRSKGGIGKAQGGIGRAPGGSPGAILTILLHKISHFFGLTPGPKPTEKVPMNTESTLDNLTLPRTSTRFSLIRRCTLLELESFSTLRSNGETVIPDREFDPVGSLAIRPWRVWEPVALGVAEPVRSVRAIHLGLEVPRE